MNLQYQLKLEPVKHVYFDGLGTELFSVSKFISKFYKHFEETQDYWLLYKSILYLSDLPSERIKNCDDVVRGQLLEYYGCLYTAADLKKLYSTITNKDVSALLSFFPNVDFGYGIEIIKQSWKDNNKDSTDHGTKIHNEREDGVYSDGHFEYQGIVYDVNTEQPDLENLKENTLYPELILRLKDTILAGTSDQVLMLTHKRFRIRDFKTNKEIKLSNKYQKMLEPIQHLDDCNYVHYILQLSIYAYMLEQLGYELDSLELEHIDREGKITMYKLPYYREEVTKMIKHEAEFLRGNRDTFEQI